MKLYWENKHGRNPLILQNYMFSNSQMYKMPDRIGNLQERVE